ncbi:undecaprenyl-diphosphatase [Rubrivivax gelatinosus]|uniref:phosphatase PAP2 family protein n=2 Tax=Rubrivivax gelatinosus TaxID=28068 RepID=UPI0018CBC5D2|nr:phosphatase PAP2 family protein [Rubrivivax gelatinosus]MBG6082363.1 undecaprenyl-diphosphatase [Rubrivivax gelatinosus]
MPRWLDASRLHGVELDRRWALALHRGAARPLLLRLLVLCSRLGDAGPWLALGVALAVFGGPTGRHCSLLFAELGLANLAIYWVLKRGTRRSRPFDQCPGIRACCTVPDRFSFPSGHTLHAVAFGLLLAAFYPAWAPLLAAFALLVALARIVLGLHYPSDVAAGAALGAITGTLVLLTR